MTMTTKPRPGKSVARLTSENERLRAELEAVRKASRQQIRDLQTAVDLARAEERAAVEAELRHLRDELAAHHLEAGQQ